MYLLNVNYDNEGSDFRFVQEETDFVQPHKCFHPQRKDSHYILYWRQRKCTLAIRAISGYSVPITFVWPSHEWFVISAYCWRCTVGYASSL